MRWLQAVFVLLLYLWLAFGVLMLAARAAEPPLSTWRNSAMITLHKGDVDTLSRTLFGEARGEKLAGMHAVAWVILNRAKRGSPRFPSTISGVCKQKFQFTCWAENDPNSKACARANDSDPFFVMAIHAATGVLAGQVPDPTLGADHYHTIGMRPYPGWASTMELTAVIGQHRFYKEGGAK
jgi:spore germination cell wall hydrolase CwlJ-like protein